MGLSHAGHPVEVGDFAVEAEEFPGAVVNVQRFAAFANNNHCAIKAADILENGWRRLDNNGRAHARENTGADVDQPGNKHAKEDSGNANPDER